jgi:hypothetical protein
VKRQGLGVIALVTGGESRKVELISPFFRSEEDGMGNLIRPPGEIVHFD